MLRVMHNTDRETDVFMLNQEKIHPTKSFSLLIAALKTLLVLDLSYGLTHPCCTKCLF